MAWDGAPVAFADGVADEGDDVHYTQSNGNTMRSILRHLMACTALAVVATGTSCSDVPVSSPAEMQAVNLLSNVYVVRTVPAASEVAEEVIDRQGGDIRVGDHVLFVPNGAVLEPTRFTVEVVAGPFVQVSLHATRVSNGATVSTFPINLRLRLNYRDAIVLQEGRLSIAYLVDNTTLGRRQKMPSNVDVFGKFVEARLSHFSTYALVID